MPQYSKSRVENLLGRGRIAVGNAQGAPEILSRLAVYSYGAEKIQEGRALLQALDEKHAARLRLHAQQKESTVAFQAAWSAARQKYVQHITIARALLVAQPERLARLGLEGARAKAFGAWLVQARQFYREALADAELQAILLQGGLTPTVLQTGQAAIEAAAQADNAQESAKGLAQQSISDRDAAAAAFQQWLRHFFKIADVALAAQPQWLERLGRLVRS